MQTFPNNTTSRPNDLISSGQDTHDKFRQGNADNTTQGSVYECRLVFLDNCKESERELFRQFRSKGDTVAPL